jgi:hypothetical protein
MVMVMVRVEEDGGEVTCKEDPWRKDRNPTSRFDGYLE